ncbi:MAG TPA: hypothetical protein PLE74_05430 [Candidatus Cloacimonadota bacterium]|nr:hypothetical protein [Candidatus Cloacimonadota bacterium]HPT71703.1 hypothetical protein [Candidatus Cloacimonadota bacterium]
MLIHAILFTFLFLYHWKFTPGAASSEIEVISIEQNGNDIFSNPEGEKIDVPFQLPKFGDAQSSSTSQASNSPADEVSSNERIRMNVMREDNPTDLGRNQVALNNGNPRGSREADYSGPLPQMHAKSLIKNMDQYPDAQRGNSPFYLEGDLQESNVVYKKIPEYPKGVQKNAQVVLQFSVFPNGAVDPNSIIVMKKADPKLDDVSIDALSQWKFTPYIGRNARKGKITFVYQIK